MKVPFLDLSFQSAQLKAELMRAFERTLDQNSFCLGPDVEKFESEFAAFSGCEYAIGVNNGTSALHLALLALGVGPGDEVITTPHTFVATSWAISYVGATIRYVDVSSDSHNIDIASIEGAITSKTKAVVPVHLYGEPARIDEIAEICRKKNIFLVEDCAQAHGALYHGRPVGTFGQFGAFSFYPCKNLGALGEGGALICSDYELTQKVKMLRNHGSKKRYYHEVIGYNYRMEGLQGAALSVKLPYLKEWTEKRKSLSLRYIQLLKDVPIKTLNDPYLTGSVCHLFVIRTSQRQQIHDFLLNSGIETSFHYPFALHLQHCYRQLGYRKGDFPHAEAWASECLSLPLFPELTHEQQDYVVFKLKEYFDRLSHASLR